MGNRNFNVWHRFIAATGFAGVFRQFIRQLYMARNLCSINNNARVASFNGDNAASDSTHLKPACKQHGH
jgi:hypothetical protein